MNGFTIDDAIERCRDRARISELHHMMHASQEWEQVAVWLERLRDAPEIVLNAKLSYSLVYPDDNMCDMRDKQRDLTRNEIVRMLEDMSA